MIVTTEKEWGRRGWGGEGKRTDTLPGLAISMFWSPIHLAAVENVERERSTRRVSMLEVWKKNGALLNRGNLFSKKNSINKKKEKKDILFRRMGLLTYI